MIWQRREQAAVSRKATCDPNGLPCTLDRLPLHLRRQASLSVGRMAASHAATADGPPDIETAHDLVAQDPFFGKPDFACHPEMPEVRLVVAALMAGCTGRCPFNTA